MAYRPDDPYNMGIGTPYLGNINMGQVPVNNIELAKTFNTRQGLLDIGAAEKGKVYGYNPTVVGDFIGTSKKLQGSQNPVTGGGDIGSIKTWMTDPKRQHIYEDYLDKSGTQFIPEIQKALEQGLFENRDDFGNQLLYEEAIKNKGDQAFLDDKWDFSNIEGHLASLPDQYGNVKIPGIRRRKMMMDKRATEQGIAQVAMQKRIQEEEKKRIEQEKIKTAQDNWKPTYNPASSHAEAQATGGDYHSGHQSTVGGQTTDWGSESAMIARGGLAQHAPRYANGGLIDFYRYGGFI